MDSNITSLLQSIKNNLIQNFYIIGFSPEDFFKLDDKKNKGEFLDIFREKIEDIPPLTPKIITKFPNIKNNINTIPDKILLEHCFPNGKLKIVKTNKNNSQIKNFFQFEFDNIPHNYNSDEKRIYSKIYFSCLEIGESISEYFKYKKEIINALFKFQTITILNYDKNIPQGVEFEQKFSHFLIPKVLCFASILPFYSELSLLLECIYDYSLSRKDFSSLPLEKVIEKIITKTPIPIKIGNELSINFKTSNYKYKLQFPLLNINEININYGVNNSLLDIFKYFSIDDVIRIFRYIIYEIPILFFSDDKYILSLFIDTFLSVLSPFKYVLPHISILPNTLYGLISTEPKYIFGINQNYKESFFTENKIELQKSIVIINIFIDPVKKTGLGKIEEKIYSSNMNYLRVRRKEYLNSKEEYILNAGTRMHIFNVDIPNTYKKFLSDGINKYISYAKKKNFFSNKENNPKDFFYKIHLCFYKFFVYILNGYTEYLIKSPNYYNNNNSKNENIGENILYRNNRNMLKELFNLDEFISKTPKEYLAFYYIFFNTKLFLNFLRERIINNTNIIDQFALRQFDQLTYLKKYSDFRKRKENKTLFENFNKDIIEKVKLEFKEEINIIDNISFSNKDIFSLITDEKKNTDILLKYGQLIKLKSVNSFTNKEKEEKNYSKLININYCVFPKLIYEYLDINNSSLNFFNHEYINNFKNACNKKKEEYIKIRPYLFYEKLFEKLKFVNNSNKTFEVSHSNYIDYIWLILSSCSLWYCEEEEKNYRMDKIFEFLNRTPNIEEYVLDILYINIYRYGDKYHLIKLYRLYLELVGNISYYFLTLLCDKIRIRESYEEEEDSKIGDEEEQNDLVLSKRYLIKLSSEFSEKRKKRLVRTSGIFEDNEEIIYSSEQLCKECNEVSDINPTEIIQKKTELNVDNFTYKCPKCHKEKDIIIKYQKLLFNFHNKEALISETGEFKFLTGYKLYKELKNYLIEGNNLKLEINHIFNIEKSINLINILFYFSLNNLSYDFLFPYVTKINSSMKLFLESAHNQINNKIMDKNVNEPIKISYKEEKTLVYRHFGKIEPKYNLKKKKSTFLGITFGTKIVETDLSFTIKNSKKKK